MSKTTRKDKPVKRNISIEAFVDDEVEGSNLYRLLRDGGIIPGVALKLARSAIVDLLTEHEFSLRGLLNRRLQARLGALDAPSDTANAVQEKEDG